MSNSNILHIITQLGYDLYSTNKLRILSSHEIEILIEIIWSEECYINQTFLIMVAGLTKLVLYDQIRGLRATN